jgi:DNA mismatch repair protein MutS2
VRHPLLDRRRRESGRRAVPADVSVRPGERVLVLSGPNTGGKTVALKTVGLAALMAQSGIPVCAAAARLPLFAQVRADIGDHQSIDADLSTFSAHVRSVARFLAEARPPALFLFDEIGSGTDPAEGSALARAVLERLLEGDFVTIATTHQGALKTWAFTTEGAASAALEFDAEALRPTYRILPGAAGVSAGLDVASRLGLDEALIERARRHMDGGAAQAEGYMRRLRVLAADAEELRDQLARREAELAEERERVRRDAERESERRRAEALVALEGVVREFREQGKRELAGIADAGERAKRKAEREQAERRLRADATRRQQSFASEGGTAAAAAPLAREPAPGAQVLVYSLGKVGEVVAVRGARVDVRLGAVVFTVGRDDLRAAPGGAAQRAQPAPPPARPAAIAAALRSAAPAATPVDDLVSSGPEVMLIGLRVEEALGELDRKLDEAARSGRATLRVVHGHGTGKLRAGVRRFLAAHPLVASHRPGSEHEGGDGATVVALK